MSKIIPLLLLFSINCGVCASGQLKLSTSKDSGIAFVHVSVVPMDRELVLEDQVVIIEDGKIAGLGSAPDVTIPKGMLTIDARGKYLLPGLADMHVHLQTPIEFPLFLRNGVTTVFNLDGRPAHLAWRKKIAAGEMQGPMIFTTGPIFMQAHTPEVAVRMVDEQAALGYDGVKIYNEVSKEEYPALIAEAKRKNMLIIGHVARKPGFALTVASGQSIAHLEEYTYTFFNAMHDDDDSHIVYDENKIPEAVALTAKAGVFVVPTLNNYAQIVQQATALDEFLKNPELRYDSPWIQDALKPETNGYKNGFDPGFYPQLRTSLAFQRKLLKALFDGGVPLLCGTDASAVGPVAGFGVHKELQEFVNDGLTPYQALQTATINPALFFRLGEQAGTIAIGKRADLVLLSANPLHDIANTRKIEGVVLHGQWLDKETLNAKLEQVPAEYTSRIEQTRVLFQTKSTQAAALLVDTDPFGSLSAAALMQLLRDKAPSEIEATLVRLTSEVPNSSAVSERAINTLGYKFIGIHKYDQAVAILRFNTGEYPKSANTWDSLAEAQFKSGDLPHAMENYRKALEVDPDYPNAETARKFLQEHARNPQ